ncbi:MAG: hypothetical protein ABFD18_11555 [Syntrophomonas sp.]
MARGYQLLMVLVLVSLVIMGLNTSNQGISRLTTENRGQVIGMDFSNEAIKLQVCSKDYIYTSEQLHDQRKDMANELKSLGEQAKSYTFRIWKIFNAIV